MNFEHENFTAELSDSAFKTSPFLNVPPEDTFDGKFFAPKEQKTNLKKRLNKTDAEILTECSYTTLSDENLKLEEKIKRFEGLLLTYKDNLDLIPLKEDSDHKKMLESQIKSIESELLKLKAEYKQKTESQKKMPDGIKQIFWEYYGKIKSIFGKDKLEKTDFISKFFPNIQNAIRIRRTLVQLRRLNKNAEELMLSKTPFGEQELREKNLVTFLGQANSIQAGIKKQKKQS